MASRSLDDLIPEVADKARTWEENIRARGFDVLIYCTYRSLDEQNVLYAIGRSVMGKKVTNAKGGQSWHQYRRAWDAVPMIGGKPSWNYSPYNNSWGILLEEATALDIEWGGSWRRFRDCCHWQVTEGLTMEQAKETLG